MTAKKILLTIVSEWRIADIKLEATDFSYSPEGMISFKLTDGTNFYVPISRVYYIKDMSTSDEVLKISGLIK